MNDLDLCWIDLATSGTCCPALHEGKDVYVVQGKEVDPDVRSRLSHLNDDEVAIETPKGVLDLLVLNELTHRDLTFSRDPDWADRYERLAGLYMLAWAQDLVLTAGPRSTDHVLDLACGTGFVGRALRSRIGDGPRITGVDLDPAMAFEASRQVDGIEVCRVPAARTGLSDSQFDIVLCQQGLQYFADRPAVLSEMYRVLKPGGRMHLSIWAESDSNPFLSAQVGCVRRYMKESIFEDLLSRNIDGVGGVALIEGSLAEAGFSEVRTQCREMRLEIGTFERYLSVLVENSTWGDFFHSELAEDRQAEVIEGVRAGFDWDGGRPVAVMNALTFSCTKV